MGPFLFFTAGATLRFPFVLFDAGETLIGPRESFGATYARVLAPLGLDLPATALEAGLRGAWEAMDRRLSPGSDRYRAFPGGEDGYWARFARAAIEQALGVAPPPGLVETALPRLRAAFRHRDAWRVYPDVAPALEALRASGARLAVVSNWDSGLPRLLRILGLSEFFDAVAVSSLEGVEKPDPGLFSIALARLGARPHEALHVGNVPAIDLTGARAAGIAAVLVDRDGRLPAGMPALADLSEIPAIARRGPSPA